MALRLTYRTPVATSLEVDDLTPDRLAGKSVAEMADLPAWEGNRKRRLGEFFAIEGAPGNGAVYVVGDLAKVHGIGRDMKSGELVVEGNVGRHAGAGMSGGRLVVRGSADDWLGAEMCGGVVEVTGSAGRCTGGVYIGSERGMNGGTIVVGGDAGDETGHTMRRGLIVVRGRVGDFAALNMIAGTVIAVGGCGRRPGAGMRRGTLVVMRGQPELLPTFRLGGPCRALFVDVYLRELARQGLAVDVPPVVEYDLWAGDHLNGGRGEVLVARGG